MIKKRILINFRVANLAAFFIYYWGLGIDKEAEGRGAGSGGENSYSLAPYSLLPHSLKRSPAIANFRLKHKVPNNKDEVVNSATPEKVDSVSKTLKVIVEHSSEHLLVFPVAFSGLGKIDP